MLWLTQFLSVWIQETQDLQIIPIAMPSQLYLTKYVSGFISNFFCRAYKTADSGLYSLIPTWAASVLYPLFFFFFFPFSHWRIIALHYVGFCHTTKWISQKYAYVSFFLSIPPLPLHLTSLGHPKVPGWAPYVIQQLLTSYVTHNSVHMSILLSQFIPTSLYPLCPQVHLHLHSFPANRFISTTFLDFIYMH